MQVRTPLTHHTPAPETTLSIALDAAGKSIRPLLRGILFEDVSYASDGDQLQSVTPQSSPITIGADPDDMPPYSLTVIRIRG